MSTHRYIDHICCAVLAFVLLLTAVFVNAEKWGVAPVMAETGYESRLFDTSKVHTIDLVMDDWEGFLDTCENEEYSACAVIIDRETYKNVGIRAKGNTSLSAVKAYGNDRYSFKIEFDCYEKGKSYHGLDKISLNNIIQDNTYMKDYLVYQMMNDFGVASPLCSYAYLTVNGEDWGLYLAVEAVEESFLARNYGNDYGNLYKPDSMDMGGENRAGGRFSMDDAPDRGKMPEDDTAASGKVPENDAAASGEIPEGDAAASGKVPENDAAKPPEFAEAEKPGTGESPDTGGAFGGDNPPESGGAPGQDPPVRPGGAPGQEDPGGPGGFSGSGKSLGSDDVALIYSDDEYESYRNIFDNAKTDITDTDKDRLIASLKKLGQGAEIEAVVDVDAVIRYFVIHNFVCNFDSYTGTLMHNYYLYEEDGTLSMIPWDYNLAFGGFTSGGRKSADGASEMVNYPIDSPVSGGTMESRPMIAWIFSNEAYTEKYHQYFAEFVELYFADGSFEEMTASVKEMIAPYVEKDPTKFCSYEEFETGVDTLKEFVLLRAESIRGQLAGAIPSTSEGQTQDASALVDASHLVLSDMGTMDSGNGRAADLNRPDSGGPEQKTDR